MAELEQPSLANSLRVPPLSILLSIRRGGSPNVFPTHWPRTTAKLLSWNCLPCTGNPCSSNLMKLRELCVIKVGRVCGMKAETPTRANSGNVKEDASFGNYYPNWTCIYIKRINQSEAWTLCFQSHYFQITRYKEMYFRFLEGSSKRNGERKKFGGETYPEFSEGDDGGD